MHLSYWEKQDLYDNKQVVIIGSGIVGLTSAIYIKELDPSIPVIILERGQLPLGASTKNAGFACFGSVSEILEDLKNMSTEDVITLIGNRYKGLQRLLSLTAHDDIEFSKNGGYEVFTDDQDELNQQCINHISACCDLVAEATGLKRSYQLHAPMSWLRSSKGVIYNPYEGQLNPLKLVQALIRIAISKNVRILNASEVVDIQHEQRCLHIKDGITIPYNKLIVCTNGFAARLIAELDVKAVRNQVLMTQPTYNLPVTGCFHFNKGYVYFRDYHGRILLGGGRNIDLDGETTDEFGHTDKIRKYLLSFLYDVIGVDRRIKVDHWWSGILGVGPNKTTIIEEYSEDLFIGVRMGGMGVALGSEVGYKLASLVVMK